MDDNKKILIDNMNKLLKQKGKLRMDMAKDLGLTHSTVFNWFDGVSYPRLNNLEQIADYFGVSITQLVGEGRNTAPEFTTINVLSRVAYGVPIKSMDYVIGSEEISNRMAKNGSYFALKVKGDAMAPKIEANDIAIIQETKVAQNGDIVVVMIGKDDAIIRRIMHNQYGITLLANANTEPLFFTHDDVESIPVKIIGKVVEVRRKF